MGLRKILAALALATSIFCVASDAAAASSATFDFSNDQGIGYADNFGSMVEAHRGPRPEDYDTMKDHGISLLRINLALITIVPLSLPGTARPVTVEAYRNNERGVADPANWNWNFPLPGYRSDERIDVAFAKGFKIILLVGPSITWLNLPGFKDNGVPRDDAWDVYADIVKKIYQRYQGKISAFEVWNEPDSADFLQVKSDNGTPGNPNDDVVDPRYNFGSGPEGELRGQITAYRDIYANTFNAIRSVDANVRIGGPVTVDHFGAVSFVGGVPAIPGYPAVPGLLQDPRIGAGRMDFISYHHYRPDAGQPWHNEFLIRANAMRSLAGNPNLPLYITEWNYTINPTTDLRNTRDLRAIPFVADRLTDVLYAHVNGSIHFSFNRVGDATCSTADAAEFYASLFRGGKPMPKMSSFWLLGKSLGLSAANFQLKGRAVTNGAANLLAGAAVNAAGERVGWVVNNEGGGADVVNLGIAGLAPNTSYAIQLYLADASHDGKTPVAAATIVSSPTGAITLPFSSPVESVVGFKFIPN